MMIKKMLLGMLVIMCLFGVYNYSIKFNHENVLANENKSPQLKDYGTLNKEDIHYKMLNSIDYFKSAKGSFTYKAAGYVYDVDYQVNMNNPKSKVKIDTVYMSQESIFDGDGNVTILETKNKEFTKLKGPKLEQINLDSKLKGKPAKSRISQNEKGEKIYDFRVDPTLMGLAATSIFPQDIAFSFLEDYDKWNFTSFEKVNGLEAIVINGELNNYFKEKHKAETFKLWIHTDTGILLKMEEYDEKGQPVEYLITKSIKLNDLNGLDKIKAHEKPEGYKDVN